MPHASEHGAIPDGWQRMRLGDFLKLEYGVSLPDRNRSPGQIPVIGSAGLVGYHDQATNDGPGIVIGRKGSIGSVTWANEDFVPIDTTYFAVPQKGKIDLRWAFHFLKREDLSKLNRATGIPGLNRDDVYALSRPIPPLAEQQAITAVLDSIDDAIEGAEAVIAATGQLRDSLLHDLLTRGLPGQHTEFRDVPGLGTIPADWEVVRLREVVPKFEYGTSVKCSSEPSGMPILRIPNIASGQLNLRDLKYADLTPKESASVQLEAGDILLVRTNGNPDICGQCWVSDGLGDGWGYASYLVRGRADRSVVNPWFVGHFLKSEVGRRLLKGNIRTSAGNYNLSVGSLGSMPLPCPPLNEQDSIVDTIRSLSLSVEVAREELAGLRLLKDSTADALLTGRVRVATEG